MAKKTFFFFIFLSSVNSYSNIDVKMYYEKSGHGFEVFVDNNEYCPVSVKIDFDLDNLKSTHGNNRIFVVPAKAKRYNVTDLKMIKRGRYGFKYESTYNYGNHFLKNYEADYVYFLPFKTENSFKVHQGYNGAFSHQNKNSLDFTMPIGTEITAARGGVVVEVVDKNNRSCEKEECADFNNYIVVYHPDGTFAEYTHIKQNGSVVKEGDLVEKGQLIAKSGNVGWSTGPHLHFVAYLQKLNERETIATKFLIDGGEKQEYLVEKKTYKRNY